MLVGHALVIGDGDGKVILGVSLFLGNSGFFHVVVEFFFAVESHGLKGERVVGPLQDRSKNVGFGGFHQCPVQGEVHGYVQGFSVADHCDVLGLSPCAKRDQKNKDC